MIIQFGTSRFLQAHVDLFLSEAGQGPVTIVQTSGDPERARRVAAFDRGRFPVQLRGLQDGRTVDRTVEVTSVTAGLSTALHWPRVEQVFTADSHTVVSNTGDGGYRLDPSDRADTAVPASFPAKLLRLLRARHRDNPVPLTLYPCELIGSNGDTLRRVVADLARSWSLSAALVSWIETDCRWVNSLVDRIVSAPIEPAGAVAEPYALWAVERQPDREPPCRHPDIVVTDRLVDYERLKLFILNGGHSFLVDRWRALGAPDTMNVRQAVHDPALRRDLDSLYDDEILPVFDSLGLGERARLYRHTTIERFANPFLDHRLSEIAGNHAIKCRRRFAPLIELAERHAPGVTQPRLHAALAAAT